MNIAIVLVSLVLRLHTDSNSPACDSPHSVIMAQWPCATWEPVKHHKPEHHHSKRSV